MNPTLPIHSTLHLPWLAPFLPPDPEAAALLALGVGGGAGLLVGAVLGGLLAWRLTLRAHRRFRSQLSHLETSMQDQFHSISSAALDRSSDRLLDLASERFGAVARSNDDALARREEAVDAMVRPIHESLAKVDEKLQQVETARAGGQANLTKHLEMLATAHRQLEAQTQSLGQALRNPNARGRWGEFHLRRVVELAGMLEHCDFEEQVSIETNGAARSAAEDGNAGGGGRSNARPDLVVQLPGGRQIAVDAKAPLDAYLKATEAPDEATRKAMLQQHAKQVRRHVDQLGSRNYWSGLKESPEFVILYLPGEPFFADAIAQDPLLIERGVERKVLLAGPTTLIALLRSVAYGWQQEAMAENAATIHALGLELFERIGTLGEHFGVLGKRLDGAVTAYNQAMASFESRVCLSARRMAELGRATPEKLQPLNAIETRTRLPENPDTDSGHLPGSGTSPSL